jgi:LPS export ABC transporter protein LptC
MVTVGCGNPVKDRHSAGKVAMGRENLVQESWVVKVILTESGIHRGIVQAAHEAEYKTKKGSEHHLDGGIRVTLFDVHGYATTTITAQKAVIHDNHDIEAVGSVVMTSNEGAVIKTEYVKRSAADSMIRSDRPVTITRQKEIIRGEGFESDQALKKYRIFRGSGEAFIKQ